MKKANIITALCFFGFALWAFCETFTFKKFKNVPVGPEVFPRALAVALMICAVALIIANLRTTKENSAPAPSLSLKNPWMRHALYGTLAIAAYALLWERISFLLATPPVIFFLSWLMGKREWGKMALVSILATVAIFLVFKYLLGITMPMGFFG